MSRRTGRAKARDAPWIVGNAGLLPMVSLSRRLLRGTAKNHARSGRRRGLPDARLSVSGRNCRPRRMCGGREVLPVPRTGAAQARLTSGISGERSESAACRG